MKSKLMLISLGFLLAIVVFIVFHTYSYKQYELLQDVVLQDIYSEPSSQHTISLPKGTLLLQDKTSGSFTFRFHASAHVRPTDPTREVLYVDWNLDGK